MRKYLLVLFLLLSYHSGFCCPVCGANQPKPLRGITHGTGPDSQWDYVIIAAMSLIVMITLFYSVKWLLRPAEDQAKHIKRFILTDSSHER